MNFTEHGPSLMKKAFLINKGNCVLMINKMGKYCLQNWNLTNTAQTSQQHRPSYLSPLFTQHRVLQKNHFVATDVIY